MTSSTRLIIASTENSADLHWATRFHVPDPIIFLEHRGKKILFASSLEFSRARKEAVVDQVLLLPARTRPFDFLCSVLKKKKIRTLLVPASFPLQAAEQLGKLGFRIRSLPDPFYPAREVKTKEEIRSIRETIRATEEAIRLAKAILRRSRNKKGKLLFQGSLLTSERLRRFMEIKMMEFGCVGKQTIIACGRQAADPHCIGFGPLYANQPIVFDVFPRSLTTGYYGDVSRTLFKGRPSDKVCEMYEAVRIAQEKGISLVRASVVAKAVHETVRKTLERFGFKTGLVGGKPQGFIHGTGHGLGLEIHEAPRLGSTSEILKKGSVVTVEPGLYYEKLGGIRIEDDLLVTQKGSVRLSTLSRHLEFL